MPYVTNAHIARIGSLRAAPSYLEVNGHIFDRFTHNEKTLLHAGPDTGLATAVELRSIRSNIVLAAEQGPQITIGARQLAELYFERVPGGLDPILTIWHLKTATQTERGLEIHDVFVNDQAITLIVVNQYDRLEALDAEGRSLPDVI